MDSFSMVLLIIIALVGWQQGIGWLFLGCLFLFIVTARNAKAIAIAVAGFGFLYFFHATSLVQSYWFVIAAIMVGLILLIAGKEEKGEEYMSPELMSLLGGGH